MCVASTPAGFHLSRVEPGPQDCGLVQKALKSSGGLCGFVSPPLSFFILRSPSFLIPFPLPCVLASVLLTHRSSNEKLMCHIFVICAAICPVLNIGISFPILSFFISDLPNLAEILSLKSRWSSSSKSSNLNNFHPAQIWPDYSAPILEEEEEEKKGSQRCSLVARRAKGSQQEASRRRCHLALLVVKESNGPVLNLINGKNCQITSSFKNFFLWSYFQQLFLRHAEKIGFKQ